MLTLSAGLIMTCMLIGFAMITWREGSKFAQSALTELEKTYAEQEEYEYLKYEEGFTSGGEVIRAITKLQKNVTVTVVNGKNRVSYNGGYARSANLPGSSNYIALSASFAGEVRRDGKGKIYEIIFTKI